MVEFLKRSGIAARFWWKKRTASIAISTTRRILEELDIEIHLVKNGNVLSKNAESPNQVHAGYRGRFGRRFYVDNLREEVIKGMHDQGRNRCVSWQSSDRLQESTKPIELSRFDEMRDCKAHLRSPTPAGNVSLIELRKRIRNAIRN